MLVTVDKSNWTKFRISSRIFQWLDHTDVSSILETDTSIYFVPTIWIRIKKIFETFHSELISVLIWNVPYLVMCITEAGYSYLVNDAVDNTINVWMEYYIHKDDQRASPIFMKTHDVSKFRTIKTLWSKKITKLKSKWHPKNNTTINYNP